MRSSAAPSAISPGGGGRASVSRRSFLGPLASGALALPALPTTFVTAQEASTANRPARMVPTLSGPVPADKLGTMLMHEHVLHGVVPDELRDQSVEIAVGHLHDAARVGIDSMACLSPARDIRLYARIAERSPVRIVVCTGSYIFSRSSPALPGQRSGRNLSHTRGTRRPRKSNPLASGAPNTTAAGSSVTSSPGAAASASPPTC
ncbi:MAG: hypothetical protein ACREH8_15595 [Opitutaceae bacterium]